MRYHQLQSAITVDTIDNINLLAFQNKILVKIVEPNQKSKTKSGILRVYDPADTKEAAYREWANSDRWGEIIKVPKSLFYDRYHSKSMEWKTELEIQAGDLVWFSGQESLACPIIFCGDDEYKLVHYGECFVAKRKKATIIKYETIHERLGFEGGAGAHPIYEQEFIPKQIEDLYDIICLNGYLLCEEIKEEQSKIILMDKKVNTSFGIVKYLGSCNKEYKWVYDVYKGQKLYNERKIEEDRATKKYNEIAHSKEKILTRKSVYMPSRYHDEDSICVEDRIIFLFPHAPIMLENEYHACFEGKKMFRICQRKDIIGRFKN